MVAIQNQVVLVVVLLQELNVQQVVWLQMPIVQLAVEVVQLLVVVCYSDNTKTQVAVEVYLVVVGRLFSQCRLLVSHQVTKRTKLRCMQLSMHLRVQLALVRSMFV